MLKINEKLKINPPRWKKQFISTIKWFNWWKNKISISYLYTKNNITKNDIKHNVELKEWNNIKAFWKRRIFKL